MEGVKIHNLHVIKNTQLADEYLAEPFPILSEHEYAEADVKDGQAPEPVGKQPRRNLPAGHANHEDADDLLRARQRRRERVDHRGNGRQAHVDRDGGRRGQQAERDDETPAVRGR